MYTWIKSSTKKRWDENFWRDTEYDAYLPKTIQTRLLQSLSSNCVSETFCMLISCSTKFIWSLCIKSNVILQQYRQQASLVDAFTLLCLYRARGTEECQRDENELKFLLKSQPLLCLIVCMQVKSLTLCRLVISNFENQIMLFSQQRLCASLYILHCKRLIWMIKWKTKENAPHPSPS